MRSRLTRPGQPGHTEAARTWGYAIVSTGFPVGLLVCRAGEIGIGSFDIVRFVKRRVNSLVSLLPALVIAVRFALSDQLTVPGDP